MRSFVWGKINYFLEGIVGLQYFRNGVHSWLFYYSPKSSGSQSFSVGEALKMLAKLREAHHIKLYCNMLNT